MGDQQVLVRGLLDAEAAGQRFLYRTAASFVQVRAGLAPQPILTAADLNLREGNGGLTIVGSYVPKTTAQLKRLLADTEVTAVELDVSQLLGDARGRGDRARDAAGQQRAGRGARRRRLHQPRAGHTAPPGKNRAAGSLSIGQRVSQSLVDVVRGLSVQPRYPAR